MNNFLFSVFSVASCSKFSLSRDRSPTRQPCRSSGRRQGIGIQGRNLPRGRGWVRLGRRQERQRKGRLGFFLGLFLFMFRFQFFHALRGFVGQRGSGVAPPHDFVIEVRRAGVIGPPIELRDAKI